jgi:hypothetical protein
MTRRDSRIDPSLLSRNLVVKPVVLLLLGLGLWLGYPLAAVCRSQTVKDQQDRQDPVELKLRVQRLLQQLEDADRSRRDAAERELSAMGEAVLPLLPETTPRTAAETKERITRIRNILDQAAIAAAMQPRRINADGQFTLAELLDRIQQQTGNRVVDFRDRFGQQPSDMKLHVAFQDADFWPALDQLLDQAGLTTYSYTGEPRTLGIVAAGEGQAKRVGTASYPGIFRVEATEIMAQRNLRTPGNAALRIRLEVIWEPRVLPVLIRQAYGDLQLTADDGSAIAVASTEGVAEAPIQSTVAGIDLIVPLQLPDRNLKKIASFKGRFYALVPGREETFEFDQLSTARNVAKQRGGLEVTLERVRQNGTVYEFRIRLRLLKEDDSFQSHLDWVSNNVVYLVNAQGEQINQPNFERYLEREREVGYGYLFPLEGKLDDYRLIYRSPAAILTVPVEYELRDIPLP